MIVDLRRKPPIATVATLHKALHGSRQVQARLDAGRLTREDAARVAALAQHVEHENPLGSLEHEYVTELVDELRHALARTRQVTRSSDRRRPSRLRTRRHRNARLG
jgi:chorismate mutase